MDEQVKRLQAIETAVQAKIDADKVYQKSVLDALAALKAQIADPTAVNTELTNLEAEITNLPVLTLPA